MLDVMHVVKHVAATRFECGHVGPDLVAHLCRIGHRQDVLGVDPATPEDDLPAKFLFQRRVRNKLITF